LLHHPAAPGAVLFLAAILAVIADNSAASGLYDLFLKIEFSVALGSLALSKPLLLWINDGLMAVFFLVVGLEMKREMLYGELSKLSQIGLPALAALGGMAVPALIYAGFNLHDPVALRGWAIPSATDIAFALGVLSLLGPRVPVALKVFLTAVAVLDDFGAIAIIALFYTADLSLVSLGLAAAALVVLAGLNFAGVRRLAPYLVVGALLWVFVLKSGVHATLAGVALAFAIPLKPGDPAAPATQLEHVLHPWVTWLILPVFAFANAGLSFAGMTLASLAQPVTLGIAGGLFLGKQIGIFAFAWAAIRLGLAGLPRGATWAQLYGVALLCGIGFTMSLFIGTLAFESADYAAPVRLGVIVGSLLSGLAGYLLLARSAQK
jgi:NhaA family Na+:H+ antiporter